MRLGILSSHVEIVFIRAALGRGLGRREYGGMGIDQNEGRVRFDEEIQIVKQLLATGQCDLTGNIIRSAPFISGPNRIAI